MIGKIFPSEMRQYTDPKSGRTITQLTQTGLNDHMYFTDNSFDLDGQEIYFVSNRANKGNFFNIFKMDLTTGQMVQLTDEPLGVQFTAFTKSPDSELIAYKTGNSIKVLNTRTGKTTLIYTEKGMMSFGQIHISPDKTTIGFARNELVGPERDGKVMDLAANYDGFFDKLFAIKDGRISTVYVDGSDFKDVYYDTHWLGHFQFSPDDSSIAMFCHEGPWNYVHQRIWVLDLNTGRPIPVFRQGPDDCVGHEYWTRSGDIVFDNRRAGHDGTISSNKTQVYAREEQMKEGQIPYFGFARRDGEVYRTIEMPFHCNHYHSNNDDSVFVGDGVEDLYLIRPKEEGATLEVLAEHNTTWKYHRSHCHPTFSWQGDSILYAADYDEEHGNLFLIRDVY